MQEWQDKGFVLSTYKYGEDALLVDILTQEHGRQKGMVKALARKNAPIYQCGNLLEVVWKARLEEHLGNYSAEIISSYAGKIMNEPLRLDGLSSVCAVLTAALPEREAVPEIFIATKALLSELVDSTPNLPNLTEPAENTKQAEYAKQIVWGALYAKWEIKLLAELGFALDLSKCAVTGETDGLCYVSPKSGRAVSGKAGAEWKDRLLNLPNFLCNEKAEASIKDVIAALNLSGYFFTKCVFGGKIPPARMRFISRLTDTDRKAE